ncbi:hypothetical protein M378DRAFT_12683 [Amanita muscaria Koide BX008]|uniref:Uncharacterized protein n=1 Tax=Amanita muscaria (strain Koide BX008) TaxID=946122 RepID=A0A0C2T7M7_AMAMK|nr:hypothetical protein M378DRAFT_12683 [Amanita muscaria Koide BX008]
MSEGGKCKGKSDGWVRIPMVLEFQVSAWQPAEIEMQRKNNVPMFKLREMNLIVRPVFLSASALSLHRKTCPGYEKATADACRLRHQVAQARVSKYGLGKFNSRRSRLRNERSVIHHPVYELANANTTASDGDSGEPEALLLADTDLAANPDLMATDEPEPVLLNDTDTVTPANEVVDLRTATGRPRRKYRLPRQFEQLLPEPPIPAPVHSTPSEPPVTRVTLIVHNRLQTAANLFGIWREYLYKPSYDPDSFVDPADLYSCLQTLPPSMTDHVCMPPSPSAATPKPSVSLLLNWQLTVSDLKSNAEITRLVKEVLLSSQFSLEDLEGFNADREHRRLANADSRSPLLDNFREVSVCISVPSGSRDIPPKAFPIQGLHYRPLMAVLHAAFIHPLALKLHYSPYKLYCDKAGTSAESERVFCEAYDSDVFIAEHDKVQRAPLSPDEPTCKHEHTIAALMFWSDATHLADFGTAKLWPVYLALGNLSKYIRNQPSAMHHVAYLPSLSDSFQDILALFHTKWNEELVHAYKFGTVIKCHDGVERRVYPRILTYGADYPEKVLLATMRDKGCCPCPRCLIPKTRVDQSGRGNDAQFRLSHPRRYMPQLVNRARDFIYVMGYPISGTAVDNLLKETSLVPTVNSFSDRLGIEFNISNMLVVDLLHEFELGVWKALFTHLIQVLYAQIPGGALINELDRRFRMMPTFGNNTIRRFATNSSEMKRMGARDFEDILQCAIPAFEKLLPEPHNCAVLVLLFKAAEWHAFAKLRMHTSATLAHLKSTTKSFCKLMRQFRDETSQSHHTVEIPREAQARTRRAESNATGVGGKSISSTRQRRQLNLSTYKFHALGDYVEAIKNFGCTDSYSTQVGELTHRTVKRLYGLTNKRSAEAQIARRYRCLENAQKLSSSKKDIPTVGEDFERHHHITHSRNRPFDIFTAVRTNQQDPAYKMFIPKLQDHILGRLMERQFTGDDHPDFTDTDRNTVRIAGNKLYIGHECRVNYTTYDIRRQSDVVNPHSHPDVITYSAETGDNAAQYWYARVIGIFHAMVSSSHVNVSNHSFQRIEILWVRWYGAEPGYRHGFRQGRMPKVGFVTHTDEDAFGFLDPNCVIRGCHMIPAFAEGRTSELLPLPKSAARVLDQTEVDDWTNYYVGIFADRDMMLRHFGGAIGHIDDPRRSKATLPGLQSNLDHTAGRDTGESQSHEIDQNHTPANSSDDDSGGDSETEQDLETDSENTESEVGGSSESESDGYASP